MDIAGLPGRGGDCILLRALHKPLHNILPTMPNKPDGCCHGRGREFESRRPRHSFRKSYANFDETNEGAKRHIFAPFLCPQHRGFPSLLARLLRAALLQVGNRCAGQHRRKHERKYSCLRRMLRRRDRLRINIQCRPEGGVSQQLLHHLQIRADTPQRTRIGMSKSMPSDSLLDSQRSRRRS